MEKLDAALNNMSHGLCMFGPDNRLLWNVRYVKMYRLAPDCLRVGCTLDDMLEARKAAGTAYRDLGQYGTKLLTVTTRNPDNLVAHLDDGRGALRPSRHCHQPVCIDGCEIARENFAGGR
jgi:PAS domain-containing protein